MAVLDVKPHDLSKLSDEEFLKVAGEYLQLQAQDRQFNALRYYSPVSAEAAKVHSTNARTIGVGGGNGASKTETCLVELLIRATGQIPLSLRDTYPREKLRGPIATRMVVESLTTTLIPIILPKMQWWVWTGQKPDGGEKGHWGWIGRHHLIGGEWKKSYTEKLRILRLLYRDTDNPEKVIGESSIQFCSYDQDASDFASGDFHFCLHDEPPKKAIWDENVARVMRVDGTIMVAMTWPSDPGIPVDWIYDEVYEKGIPGPQKDPGIEWINLYSTHNPHLNQTAVAERAGQMSDATRQTRIYGQPIRLSNRVHSLFTDTDREWCFQCNQPSIADEGRLCSKCQNELTTFNHVHRLKADANYPVIYALDPHPRKPHCMGWFQINPNDDVEQIAELEFDGGPEELWDAVQNVESEYGWTSIRRIMDPNMGASPSDARRELTWQQAFERAGLVCDLADDSDVGSKIFDTYLKPDAATLRPRALVDPRCVRTIYQIRRFLWDDYRTSADREQKQVKKKKHDDFPALWRYVMNTDPSFRALRNVGQVYRRQGERGEHGY